MHPIRRRCLSALGLVLATSPASFAADATWQASVTRAISESEYHLSLSDSTGDFTAPNRAHDFRTHWSNAGGITLESRSDAKAWAFSYRLRGVGRGVKLVASEVRRESVSDGRIEWQRDGLREWYKNDARGIEQGFVLESRPGGDADAPLVIEGAIEGLLAYPGEDGRSVLFRTPHGKDALRMRDLSATDATGHAVTACFEVGVGRIAIMVDDRGAAYPLTVSPLMTSPAWTAESDQVDAYFGYSVATAGDVNGDGYSDVIAGALTYDNGELNEGRAFVYLGSPRGLGATAAWTAEGNLQDALFGSSVASTGDVNGDGYSDVIVGASGYSNGEIYEGAAFLYLGSPSGLGASATWTAEGNQMDANFGASVATAGDVDGDGYSDVIVGAFSYDSTAIDEGRVYVYAGSPTGLASNPARPAVIAGEVARRTPGRGAAAALATLLERRWISLPVAASATGGNDFHSRPSPLRG